MNRIALTAGTVAALVAPLALAPVAHAQSGLQVLEQAWDPISREVKSLPSFKDVAYFREGAKTLWQKTKPELQTQMKSYLGQSGLLKGQTAYDIEVQLGNTPTVRVSNDGSNQLTLSLSLTGNTVRFTTTQPTIAGKYADPRLAADFDIEVEIVLEIPSDLGPLRLARDEQGRERAVIRTTHGHLSSQNLPADVAKAVVDLVSSISQLVGGPDFWEKLEQQLNRQRSIARQVDSYLTPVNTTLASLKAKGYAVLMLARTLLAAESPRPTLVASRAPLPLQSESGSCLTLLAYRTDYAIPTTGSGVLRGTIRWDKALGVPTRPRRTVTSVSSPFVFHARLQAGPQQESALGAPTKDITRPVYGTLVETEREYEFRYEVFDLPNDLPLDVARMGLASDTSWGALNPQPLPPKEAAFSALGWSGTLRILRPLPLQRLDPAVSLSSSRFSCAVPQLQKIQKRPLKLDGVTRQPLLRPNPEARGILEGIDFLLTVVPQKILR